MRSFMTLEKLQEEKRGFSLIETIMVLVIVAVLVAIVLPGYEIQHAQSGIAMTKSNLANLRTAILLFHEEESQWPANDLSDLTNGAAPSGKIYLPAIPADGIMHNNAVTNSPDYMSGGWYWDNSSHVLALNLSGTDANGDQYAEY